MTEPNKQPPCEDLAFHYDGFHELMPYRVQSLLLVSSLYESFILEEEGLLAELITSEYLDLNLSHAPRVSRVSTAQEAIEFIKGQAVDLVVTMTRLGDWTVVDFARAVKELRPQLPVVVLATEPTQLAGPRNVPDRGSIDRLFVWNGDAKIFLALIKFVEDQRNVEHDTRVGDVRVIILVENSVRFYSAYLPLIYTELMKLTQSLMSEGINRMHRLLRMRARPRILLAETFEEAWDLYQKYSSHLLGVISDIRFPRNGKLDPRAGLEFTRRIKADSLSMPVLLQSSDDQYAEPARRLNACFLNKKSPSLLNDLRSFILGNLGFGDFVFVDVNGNEVARAHDLRSFEEAVAGVPEETLRYHASHNHFSNWLMARTEFEMAARIRPRKVSDFSTMAELRRYLLNTLAEFRERSRAGVIADFSPRQFDKATAFTRIGGGSMGGKARGLAFINALLRRHNLSRRFDNVRIAVPTTAVIGTEVFETFLDENRLHRLVARDVRDERLVKAFLAAKLPESIRDSLSALLELVRYPLAVRSSSLLEDSQDRPFAGIYATHMIPNNHPELSVRLGQLCNAIKLVYASTFFRSAKRYLEATEHRADEERMGVILQEVVGSRHETRFYPTFSGIARSYNFYPTARMRPEEGVACVALGLGKMVVEGGQSLMFSPAHPRVLPQFPTTEEMLAHSQREFFALDLSRPDVYPTPDTDSALLKLGLDVAEQDGTLEPIGSVHSAENDVVYDGIFRPGTRLVTFAHVLKAGVFPLADILRLLVDMGGAGMACPIEIEFAVDMSAKPMTFGFLQIRPNVSQEEFEAVSLPELGRDQAVCYSTEAMGNGRFGGIHDLVYVKPDAFDSMHTRQIAEEIGHINDRLRSAGRRCVLIGPGRWGTSNPGLGIPVTWERISAARVLVETSLHDFIVTPSQGTHFFQSLCSLRIGYLSVNPAARQGFIDWEWLAARPAVAETRFLRHLRLDEPFVVKLDGRTRRGAVLKHAHGAD